MLRAYDGVDSSLPPKYLMVIVGINFKGAKATFLERMGWSRPSLPAYKKKGRPREATLSTGAVLFWRDSEA